jgi:hypothetical protein
VDKTNKRGVKNLTFTEWMRKKWYIFLACVVGGAMLAQLLGDLFFAPLARFSVTVGGTTGFIVSYLIYKSQYPENPA